MAEIWNDTGKQEQPGPALSLLNTARAFADLGETATALEYYGQLFRQHDPLPAQAWIEGADLLRQHRHLAAAEACLRRAISQQPASRQARFDLAELLLSGQRYAEAVDAYHDVLSLDPAYAPACAGLGQALISLGRLAEAEDQIDQALLLDPLEIPARLARARLNLLDGYFEGAWDDLDWRWKARGKSRPHYPGDTWDGNSDVLGCRIVLWADGSVANTILLLRYVPLVLRRGASVWLHVADELVTLARSAARGIHVHPLSLPLPMEGEFDLNAGLSDLPRLFDTNQSSIPPAPYLQGRASTVSSPPTALLKVGLNWLGDHAETSIDPEQAVAILGMPHVMFCNLLPGPASRHVREQMHPCLLADLSRPPEDYAVLAGHVAAMDLIITVDGPLAHLAGAMGKEVWVMLPLCPDWPWGLEREQSPWYGSARLFRQQRQGRWTEVVEQVRQALDERTRQEMEQRQRQAQARTGSHAVQDVILGTHLLPGDLLLDVGCGSGELVRTVAAYPVEDVRIIAMDSRRTEIERLGQSLQETALADGPTRIVCLTAAIGSQSGPAVISAQPRCGGRTVFPLPDWVRATVRQMPLSQVLAEHAAPDTGRLILRLGKVGNLLDVLRSLGDARPALITFDHRPQTLAAESWLQEQGYSLYQFPDQVASGRPVPFDGQNGQVLALAADCPLAELYGNVHDPRSLAALNRGRHLASVWAERAWDALAQGQGGLAQDMLGKALAQDIANPRANAGLGQMMRALGRPLAAMACWMRASDQLKDPVLRAELGGLLRELGHYDQAEALILRSLLDHPDHPALLLSLGRVLRDSGQPRQALAHLERAERLAPALVPHLDIAWTLLKSGNTARGMAEMGRRPPPPLPPLDLPFWQGHRLDGQWILVRDENSLTDTITLCRFIPQLVRLGGLVSVECMPEAARLLAAMGCVEQAVARGQPLPPMDIQVHLLDIPRLLGTTRQTTPLREVPYLYLPDDVPPHIYIQDGCLQVGIAWEMQQDSLSPLHVEDFLPLTAIPHVRLHNLQQGSKGRELVGHGADMLIHDLALTTPCQDLADLAALIAGLDLVIAADSVHAHLAAAMGKPVWVLLPRINDWRWVDGRDDCIWYPTMRVFRQDMDGSWNRALGRIQQAISAMAAGKVSGVIPDGNAQGR